MVGRCSSLVHLSEVEDFLIKGRFKEFKLRRLQSNELLFIFKHEKDYLRWFSRRRWKIKGCIITICKWTPEHEPSADSPLFPLWVELKNFPIHLNDHKAIFSIAFALGKPIKLDSNSVIGVKPDQIRVCVERELSIPFPSHIHLRLGTKDLWLPCRFENPPLYCPICHRLISLRRAHDLDYLCILEPMVNPSQLESFRIKLNFSHSLGSQNNKKWIFWNESCFKLISFSDFPQVTSCLFTLQMDNSPILISGVYGAHTILARKELWEELSTICPSNKRWIVGGDFNAITSPHESKGTCPPNQLSMEDFNSCILHCKLINLDPIGSTFTWSSVRSQGRTWRRLDRVMIHLDLLAFFQDVELHHLAKANSDHKPILLHCNDQIPNTPKPFRFLNTWTLHENFLHTVKLSWENSPTTGGMRGLLQKLKAVKQTLKKWNKDTFGNIHSKLKEAEARANQSQKEFEDFPNEENITSAQRDNAALIVATNMENKFQAPATSIPDLGNILPFIPPLISNEDNLFLTKLPDLAEVKATVWDLDPDSASGPDGFNGNFFRACWDIIQQDVLTASQELFLGLPIPKGYGSTLITLIPKKENPKRFDDFRPISLSTFLSKINTKLLANRLKMMLPKLISPEQGAFQKGKSIDDHILLAQEAIHGLDRKVLGGNLLIKIDMAKAFDYMNWSFLEGTLGKFGFSQVASNMLMANLWSSFISVLINGEPHGFFPMTRGVKQGDPLSPLLFILGFEAFSRYLNQSMESNTIKRFNLGSVRMPSHLIYADELMIFTKGDILNLLKLNQILKVFMQASGQQINFSKSRFYTPKSTAADQQLKMEKAMSMKCGSLPFTYLGATLRRGNRAFRFTLDTNASGFFIRIVEKFENGHSIIFVPEDCCRHGFRLFLAFLNKASYLLLNNKGNLNLATQKVGDSTKDHLEAMPNEQTLMFGIPKLNVEARNSKAGPRALTNLENNDTIVTSQKATLEKSHVGDMGSNEGGSSGSFDVAQKDWVFHAITGSICKGKNDKETFSLNKDDNEGCVVNKLIESSSQASRSSTIDKLSIHASPFYPRNPLPNNLSLKDMKALNLKAEDIGKDSMMTSSSSKSPVGMLGTRVDDSDSYHTLEEEQKCCLGIGSRKKLI
ncbi:unnamed protein product [Cuscuta campestris]|uniref:Reverse transcriptase domain-containing protein n=1 Tax=Cuscuta campestris TaxID=132261 RepID=A0A484L3D5_9ASTE|nr:unnamed protein product [Cuscuta campestris]